MTTSQIRVGLFVLVGTLALGQLFLSFSATGRDAAGISAALSESASFLSPIVVASDGRTVTMRLFRRHEGSGTPTNSQTTTRVLVPKRYYELREEIIRLALNPTEQSSTVAQVVEATTSWFAPKKICFDSCCAETVAKPLDLDNRQLVTTRSPMHLADILYYDSTVTNIHHHGPVMFNESMIPCFQPGTILWIINSREGRAAFRSFHKKIDVPYIVFFSKTDDDSPLLPFIIRNESFPVLKWYGTNPNLQRPKQEDPYQRFEAFPLGLWQESRQSMYLDSFLQLTGYSNPFRYQKDRWLNDTNITADDFFVKFGVNPFSQHRQLVLDTICPHQSSQTYENVSCTTHRIPLHDIYTAASRFRFAVSPPGNGWDCYRNYEMLLLGVIPIVHYRPNAPKLFEGLPVVFVKQMIPRQQKKPNATTTTATATLEDYIQAARSYILSDDFQNNSFDGWDRLFLRYWRRKILKDAGRLDSIIQDEFGREYFQAWKYTLR